MTRESSGSKTGWLIKGVVLLVLAVGLGVVIWSMLGSESLPPGVESSGFSPAGSPERSATSETAVRSDPLPPPAPQPATPTASMTGPTGAQPLPEAPRRGVRGTVKDPTGEPIPDAVVSARIQVWMRGVSMRPTNRTTEVRTDPLGYYAVPIPETTVVHVKLRAAAPGRFTEAKSVALPPKKPGFQEAHFVLGEPGSLEGTIRVKGGGDPSGARITLEQVRTREYHTAEVGPDGQYRLDALSPGSYRLEARWHGGPRAHDDRPAVEIVAGRTTRVDLALPPRETRDVSGIVQDGVTKQPVGGIVVQAPGAVTTLQAVSDDAGRFTLRSVWNPDLVQVKAPGWHVRTRRARGRKDAKTIHLDVLLFRPITVRGRVVSPDGSPVPGARVTSPSQTTTGADGRFEATASPAFGRDLHVRVEADDFAPAALVRKGALVAGAIVDDIEIKLQKGGMVVGRLLEANRTPLPDLSVALRAERSSTGQSTETVETGQDGRFRFEHVVPGKYRLRVRAGEARRITHEFEVVEVADGQTLELGDLVMPPSVLLSLHVVDNQGRGVSGADVRLCVVAPLTEKKPAYTQSARTDHQGRLATDVGAPGRYDAYVSCRGFQPTRVEVSTGAANAPVVLMRLGAISGRVVRAATGEPVTDFSLQVEGKDSHPFSRRFLDQDGRFTLAELEDDTYDIEAIGSSGAVSDVRTRVVIRNGETPPSVTLRLRPTATVEGEVHGPDGCPVGKARVALFPRGRSMDDVRYSAATDHQGRFRMEHVRPGHYDARATHLEWIEAIRSVTVVEQETARVVIQLTAAGATLDVTARDARDGTPLPDVRITVHRPDGALVHANRLRYEKLYSARKKQDPALTWEAFCHSYMRTDPAGRMQRTFLPSGSFRLRATCDGYRTAEVPVELAAGVTIPVVIQLAREAEKP